MDAQCRLVATAVDIGTEACSKHSCFSILVMCWSCGRIANAVTGTSTRHPRTCLSARTSAPGVATARRTSCAASARTVAASLSGARSARPACSQSTRHQPSELSGQGALRRPPADPLEEKAAVLSPRALIYAGAPRARASSHRRAIVRVPALRFRASRAGEGVGDGGAGRRDSNGGRRIYRASLRHGFR